MNKTSKKITELPVNTVISVLDASAKLGKKAMGEKIGKKNRIENNKYVMPLVFTGQGMANVVIGVFDGLDQVKLESFTL